MKKWSYAAAMLLIASSGCVFTGCIDNDEPYGIEQIRLATAKLLEAKKDAVAAEAAAANANLEIAKINAEIEKLRVENEKIIAEAQAKVLEAEAEAKKLAAQAAAAVSQAQADQLAAQAALAQANADDIKAKTQAYIDDQKAILDEKIALAEINVKQAQLKYDKALYTFEQRKATEADNANDELWKAVEAAFGSYLWNLDAYNSANKDYLEATRRLAELEADIKWVPNANGDGGSFQSPSYDQKATLVAEIARIQTDIEVEQKTIDICNEFNDKLETVKEGELYSLLEEYEGKLTTATEAYYQALADLDAVKIEKKDEIEKPAQIDAEIKALEDQVIDVPAWTYEPIPQLQVLGAGWDEPKVIVPVRSTYKFSDTDAYDEFKEEYSKNIKKISSVFLDENDKLWTAARLKELARLITPTAEKVTKAWLNAKEVYNNGDAAKADKAPQAAEVSAAAQDYNTKVAAIPAAKTAYWTAYDALYGEDGAQAKYNNLIHDFQAGLIDGIVKDWMEAEVTYNTNNEEIDKAQKAAQEAALATHDAAVAAADVDIQKTQEKADELYRALEAAMVAAGQLPWEEDTDPKVIAARAEYDNALQANSDARAKKLAAEVAFQDAIDKSLETQRKDRDANQAAWDKAQADFEAAGGMNAFDKNPTVKAALDAKNEAEADLQKKADAFNEKNQAANDALGAFNNAVYGQVEAIVKLMNNNYTFAFAVEPNDDVARDLYDLTHYRNENTVPTVVIPFAYQQDGEYVNAKNYVETASRYTFGELGSAYDNNDSNADWDQDIAVLLNIDFTKPIENQDKIFDLFNTYISEQKPDLTPWSYQTEYNLFGAYADVLAALYKYKLGTVANDANYNTIVEALLKEPKANLDAMIAQHDEIDEQIQQKTYDMAKAQQVADGILAEATKAEVAARNEKSTIESVVNTLKNGIAAMEANAVGVPQYYLDYMKAENETQLKQAEKALASAQTELEKAQYQLDQYENGYTKLDNPYSYEVEYLKTKVENAKELVDFSKARYEELQAKYDAANK